MLGVQRLMRGVGVLTLMTLPALATVGDAGAASQEGVKIGFIDSMEVLYETEEGKLGLEELNQFMAGRQQEFQTQQNELQRLQEQFATQQATLNPETRNEMRRDIEERERRLNRFREDAQLEFNRRQQQLLERIGERVESIITDYAEENGFGVIMMRDESQAYVDPSLDITHEIIRIYNERHGGAAPSPGGAQP